jgi:hypothetical protein
MFPISTSGGGTCMAFPDTCKVPAVPQPIPTPFPNTAQLMMVNRATCALKVNILMQPVVTMKSMVPMTSGDQAGAAGGVQSGVIMGPAKPVKGSMKVMAEGSPVVHHTCQFGQNGAAPNAPLGVHDAPSQVKVFAGG